MVSTGVVRLMEGDNSAAHRRAASRRVWLGRCALLTVGTGLLAATLRIDYQDVGFYVASALLGVCWTAGWWVDRPVEAGRGLRHHRTWPALAWGVVAGGLVATGCALGAMVLHDAPVIGPSMTAVLGPVDAAVFVPVLVTAIVVGASEELAFRGMVYRWFVRHPVAASTVVYTVVTMATGSIALVAAAAVLGSVTGWLRHRTDSLTAPLACHAVWSLLSLAVLPSIIVGM